jgi:predicted RNA-binding protein with PUA-like domain
MPALWLLKTDPSTYSFEQLLKEGRTVWDGVRNNLALMHLRAMKTGDQLLIYHSGAVKAVVGTGRVARAAYPDPTLDDPKVAVIDVVPEKRLPSPIPLSAIKADQDLAELPLVRMPRLSVMPISAEQWKRILGLAQARV